MIFNGTEFMGYSVWINLKREILNYLDISRPVCYLILSYESFYKIQGVTV